MNMSCYNNIHSHKFIKTLYRETKRTSLTEITTLRFHVYYFQVVMIYCNVRNHIRYATFSIRPNPHFKMLS